jgi:nuclear transport factor 2 (NTF2) superfamily protein
MKKNVPDSALGRLYNEHIDFILAKNVDGLLGQYAEDCLLISTLTDDKKPLYVRGHKELEEFFRSRIFSLADLSTEIAQWAETPNTLMVVEAIDFEGTDGSKGRCRFYDNWVLDEDGKIKIHFAGVVQYPDGSIA